MNINRSRWFIGILITALIAVYFTSLKSSPIAAQSGLQGGRRVVIESDQQGLSSSFQARGGQILSDYGEFQLIELPPGSPIPEGARLVEDVIHLRGFDLDTRQPSITGLAPQLVQNSPPEGKGFWMVQFAGPIQDEWLNGLRDQDLEIVAYLPENAYVVWGNQPEQRAAEAAAANPLLTWQGAYQPAYRLDQAMRALAVDPQASPSAEVTVQIYRTKQTAETIARLAALADEILKPASTVLQYTNLSLRLPSARLIEVASMPDVFDVEIYARPVLLDEAQGQIVAGNLTTSAGNVIPTGPGYLAWLASKGFPTTPNSYPIVDVFDDGIDLGYAESVIHPDFYELGDPNRADRIAFLNNCTSDPLPNGFDGHGNLNAGIIGGYNNLTGWRYEDGQSYNYGLGISPFGRLAGTKIFNQAGDGNLDYCGTEADAVYSSYISGSRITNNSWGYDSASLYGAYNINSQMYDVITRDAVSNIAGYQSMLHVFSAGNRGDYITTVLPPATAKNVMAVGATENVRGQSIYDGCNVNYANNADDIAVFSSRGPTLDLRVKPDIMAPGTHVQGPASQDPQYTGYGVCNKYYPASQTLYTWSSGTSHSAPAVAGAAQLAYEYYGRVLDPGETPSPAMLKALLLNAARYLNGYDAGGTLPSNNQGWGDVDLGRLFDGIPRQVIDQTRLFTTTGDSETYQWQVVDPTKPVRATLVWTDAPGATTGSAYVNNLDLEVTVGGQTYRGNVFSGALSISGGSFDFKNNVENVFLPTGTTGPITVKVTAANLAGNGLPGQGDATDQDFALVVYNAANPLLQAVEIDGVSWNDSLGNNNGVIDPGERLLVTVDLRNKSQSTVQQINAVLETAGPGSVVQQPNSTYPDIPADEVRSNLTAFVVDINPGIPCGNAIQLQLRLTANLGSAILPLPELSVSGTRVYSTTQVPLTIPDYDSNGVLAPISIPDRFTISDLNVKININHTWDSDLKVSLIPPGSDPIILIENRGMWGLDFQGTVLDDEASTDIANGTAPFSGSYRPEQALSAVDGDKIEGTWNLQIVDTLPGDMGELTGFDLIMSTCDKTQYSVYADKQLLAGTKGSSLTFTLTLNNTGFITDTYTVALLGNHWPTSVSTDVVGPITVGTNTQITVTVTIPADATEMSDQVTVSFTPQSNPALIQSVILTTGTGLLYLPQIRR